MLKGYLGVPREGRFVVAVIKAGTFSDLDEKRDLIDFKGGGFSWGVGEGGADQVALALLADVIDDETALRLYRPFRQTVFEFMPSSHGWTLNEAVVAAIAQSCELRMSAMASREVA